MADADIALLTIGEIARHINQPLHRVDYVIRTRGIQPLARAGGSRVFSKQAMEEIAEALSQIDAEQGCEW